MGRCNLVFVFSNGSCSVAHSNCPPGCNNNGQYNGIPPAQPETPERREQIYDVLASTSKQSRGSLASSLSQMVSDRINNTESSTR